MPLIDNGLYKMDDFNFESVREGGVRMRKNAKQIGREKSARKNPM